MRENGRFSGYGLSKVCSDAEDEGLGYDDEYDDMPTEEDVSEDFEDEDDPLPSTSQSDFLEVRHIPSKDVLSRMNEQVDQIITVMPQLTRTKARLLLEDKKWDLATALETLCEEKDEHQVNIRSAKL